MKGILSGLLFATCLCGQPASLKTTLIELSTGQVDHAVVARQMVDAMMSLADPDRRPSRQVVEDFAAEFTRTLAGNKLIRSELPIIELSLTQVMKGSTTNLKSSNRFRDVLEFMRVSPLAAGALTSRFLAIGEEVRGPDDFHISRMK